MARRKGISKKTRFEVFKRDSFTCQYCGRSAPEVILRLDHIQPVSKEGDNDLLNLITACFDCNAGKSDRLVSDDSVIAKQKAQLDELNARREQLEMMLQWREGMRDINELSVDAVIELWKANIPGYSINDQGRLTVKKLIKTFGANCVLESLETSITQYLRKDKNGKDTAESVSTVFQKIGGICRMASQPEWKRELYYIRGILRNRIEWYFDNQECFIWLENAYDDGVPLETLRSIACRVNRWDELADELIEAREKYSGQS
jgi:hypothetical protein